uniref:WGS project CBMI000000000 data, contig CS3069_c004356 n=1 Tax=Fusarium clavum TaxID=2594811 RepID=A0A090MEF4_9HYPO|nr:unnamed protein product [Fusarium clavum]CEG05963.1 unnamed protein product [Fusarium clavum]
MTEESVKGESPMIAEDTGQWIQTYVTNYSDMGWFNSTQFGVAVEYHFSPEGELQVRWAKIEQYFKPYKGEKLPVMRRVTYTMRHAVAEVGRLVDGLDCSRLFSVQVLSISHKPPADISEGEVSLLAQPEWDFARTLLKAWAEYPQDGVGTILQVAMTLISGTMGLADRDDSDPNYPFARFVPQGTYPFGPEIAVDVETRRDPDLPSPAFIYPYLAADGWMAAGIIIFAAYGFIGIGCFSIMVALIRIYIGVPV